MISLELVTVATLQHTTMLFVFSSKCSIPLNQFAHYYLSAEEQVMLYSFLFSFYCYYNKQNDRDVFSELLLIVFIT